MDKNNNPQPNIDEIRDLLSPYIDGEVTDEERVMVEKAVASSEELQDELDLLQQTVSLVSALPPMPAPRPFTLTEADVQAISPTQKKRAWWPAWAGSLAMLAATLLCAVVAGGVFFGSQMGSGGSAPAAEIAMQQESAAPTAADAEAPQEKQAAAVTADDAMAEEGSESQADMAAAEPEMEEEMAGERAEEEMFEAAEAEMAPEEPAMEEAEGEAEAAPPVAAIEQESEDTTTEGAMMAEADQDYADEAAPMPAAPANENALSLTAPTQSESADAARSGIAPTASPPPPPAPVAKEEALPRDSVETEEEPLEEKMVGRAEAASDLEDTDTNAEQQLPQIEATGTESAVTPLPASTLTATPSPQPIKTPTISPTVAPEVRATEAVPPASQPGWVSPGVLFMGVVILSVLVIIIVAVLIIWVSIKNRNR